LWAVGEGFIGVGVAPPTSAPHKTGAKKLIKGV